MDLDWDGAVETEMVEIWATDIIKADSHPCGHELSYSFDQAGLQDSIIYGCDDIGFNSVRVWVTDLVNGSQSFCWTEIEVQDNNNLDICGGAVHNPTSDGDVSGLIMTESGSQVAEATVRLLGSELPNATTDVSGLYAFNDMPIGGNYTVVPEKDINYINGVDIVQLRKLILGEIDGYANNESWRFVDEQHVFTEQSNPWTGLIPEEYDIVDFDDDMTVDFVGVKIGDVSGNAKGDELVTAEVRSSSTPLEFKANVTRSGAEQVVSFSSDDIEELSGYQMTIEFDANQYELLQVEGIGLDLSAEHVGRRYADRGMMTMSWHTEEAVSLSKNDILFKLYFRAKGEIAEEISLTASSSITQEEAYYSNKVTDRVEIEMIDNSTSGLMVLNQNEPNPWRESTVIGFSLPDRGTVQMRLYDNTGKLIRTIRDNYGSGENEIMIGRDIIQAPGIYLYEIQYRDQIEHKRMIVLD